MFKVIISLFCVLILSSCSSSYKELTKINTDESNKFSNSLFKNYKKKAIFEAEKMHDWNSAKLYSEKALGALNEENIKPQEISYWKLSKEHIGELNKSYENLMIIYDNAMIVDPNNLAIAISSLDCWAEQQEENWQIWDINSCKEDFLDSMHSLYHKISENISEKINLVGAIDNNKVVEIIYFDFDKYTLSNNDLIKLRKFIYKNTNNKYILVGHTDTKGTKEYNLSLSIKRAESIKKFLIQEKISIKNISIVGKGEELLAISTSDEVAHPANRRVEITLSN